MMKFAGKYAERTFRVKSKTVPNKSYKVELWGDGHLECECLYNYYKFKDCSHIMKVRSLLAKEKNNND